MSRKNKMEYFSKEVCAAIGYCVYRLIDPRKGLTFYVGKDIGNQAFAYAKEATASVDGEAFERTMAGHII